MVSSTSPVSPALTPLYPVNLPSSETWRALNDGEEKSLGSLLPAARKAKSLSSTSEEESGADDGRVKKEVDENDIEERSTIHPVDDMGRSEQRGEEGDDEEERPMEKDKLKDYANEKEKEKEKKEKEKEKEKTKSREKKRRKSKMGPDLAVDGEEGENRGERERKREKRKEKEREKEREREKEKGKGKDKTRDRSRSKERNEDDDDSNNNNKVGEGDKKEEAEGKVGAEEANVPSKEPASPLTSISAPTAAFASDSTTTTSPTTPPTTNTTTTPNLDTSSSVIDDFCVMGVRVGKGQVWVHKHSENTAVPLFPASGLSSMPAFAKGMAEDERYLSISSTSREVDVLKEGYDILFFVAHIFLSAYPSSCSMLPLSSFIFLLLAK